MTKKLLLPFCRHIKIKLFRFKMKYIWLISSCFFCMFIAACASNPKIIPSAEVKDLRSLPQDALFYLKDKESTQKNLNKENSKSLEILKKDYLAKYFSPWHQKVNPKKKKDL